MLSPAKLHTVLAEGHTAITNVECFSGGNGALTNVGQSQDFLLVRGDDLLTISLVGCRMRNYAAEVPITVKNLRALIQVSACVDKNQKPYDKTHLPKETLEQKQPM